MSNDCNSIKLRLSEYIDGALDRDTTWRVKMHLDACAECSAEAGALRRTADLLHCLSPSLLSSQFDANLASKLTAYLPPNPATATPASRLIRNMRMARLRWQGRASVLIAGAGTLVAAGIVVLALVAPQPVSMLSIRHPDVRPAALVSQNSIPAQDIDFVAACASQNAMFEAAQPIADPSADIVAARVDEPGATFDTHTALTTRRGATSIAQ